MHWPCSAGAKCPARINFRCVVDLLRKSMSMTTVNWAGFADTAYVLQGYSVQLPRYMKAVGLLQQGLATSIGVSKSMSFQCCPSSLTPPHTSDLARCGCWANNMSRTLLVGQLLPLLFPDVTRLQENGTWPLSPTPAAPCAGRREREVRSAPPPWL